ncbi:thioester reductase domain-containing protein [Undibacterium sp.]|uniref:thioester reductase domain-containing protein n=1 Tax=Undibacterium sp. TaxID=1914977 RepID=UPI003750E7C9
MDKAAIEQALMAQDLCLLDHLQVHGEARLETRCVLITGATGFLGRYLLMTLLEQSQLQLLCLVRAATELQAQEKLLKSLQLYDASITSIPARISVVCGRLTAPQFGLSEASYQALAEQVDTVYHCAGEVNWVRTYRHLRETNVIGTAEVVRFACTGQVKRLIFFSSLAVCFAPNFISAPELVNELTDYLPFLHQMAMGYAKSKCVAEQLLKTMAQRGLPVKILRVGLISGDSQHGTSNPTDLLAAMIQGAVASGRAIDADWLIDVLPVDFVVDATLRLPEANSQALQVWHLHHPHPRHWREIILWLNLYGYAIQPQETEAWLQESFADGADISNPIYGFKRFFYDACSHGWHRPFEAYLAQDQKRIDSQRSWQQLGAHQAPPLESGLLHLYLDHYQRSEKLPCLASAERTPERQAARQQHTEALHQSLEVMLQRHLKDASVELLAMRELAFQSQNGILNEVAAASVGSQVGVRQFELRYCASTNRTQIQTLRILIKTKISDVDMQNLLAQGARICDARIADYFLQYPNALGLRNAHVRELALYQWAQPQLRRWTPACLGVIADHEQGLWSVVLEYIEQVELADISRQTWCTESILQCIDGLAKIHAISYGNIQSLPSNLYIEKQKSCAEMLELRPLLMALTAFSEPYINSFLGHSLRPLQEQVISHIEQWWHYLLAQKNCLIHNDFNPRNFTLIGNAPQQQICVFDWELACIDLPQHDLAELLCFTLPANTTAAQLIDYVEQHRLELARVTHIEINQEQWRQGLQLALQHLIILRIPSYTLFHRFKQQNFLPQVLRNWQFMYQTLVEMNDQREVDLLVVE